MSRGSTSGADLFLLARMRLVVVLVAAEALIYGDPAFALQIGGWDDEVSKIESFLDDPVCLAWIGAPEFDDGGVWDSVDCGDLDLV